MTSNNKILLNDLLKLNKLDDVKIRFNLMFKGNWNPVEYFKNGDDKTLLEGQYWNYQGKKSYKENQTTIGFLKLNDENLWLLFHIGRITKDLDKLNGIGYEHEVMPEFQKFFGRLVIRFKNKSQNMIRLASSVINECEVVQILPDYYDNDLFPGYDKVNLTWNELERVVKKESWKTALQNQKGIYLIIDSSNGKMYVGSAYGESMILGRWLSYVKTGHGGNSELKKIGFDNIKNNFKYSILEIFKSTTDDQEILNRESWWKNILKTREFGYNKN